MRVIKGDKVKILRGQHRGKSGKVEIVDVKNSRVAITGIDLQKIDGSKAARFIAASNCLIEELNLDDKKRIKKGVKNGKKSS